MKKKDLIIIAIAIAIVLIGLICIVWYNMQLKPVNTKSVKNATIEIESGMRTEEILSLLKNEGIIKNVFASEAYIKLNNIKGLQAGKYSLSSDMSLDEVLSRISSGEVLNEEVTITFLEGKNMRWIAKTIEENTNNSQEQVFQVLKNKDYIQSLINKYWFLTGEILNESIYYPLEGYLWPETYKFENKDISVEEIFNILLEQTNKEVSGYKESIINSGLNPHQIFTIASIVELEGNDSEARSGISRVIYNRLSNNMSIGSDVTTYYAIQVDMNERNLYSNEINQYNPYNTRGPNMSGRLPVGPIASVSKDSINATLNPVNENYFYFVSDTNGKIYFSNTYEEHQSIIENLRKQGLWYEYEE